jgi:hypothetical protein
MLKYLDNVINIITNDYGFANSVKVNKPVNKDNNPIPLYTYPAIEYLNQFDFNDKKIFEFGSGNSTLYWLEQGADVTSVEHNNNWVNILSPNLNFFSNHQYIVTNIKDEYVNSILRFANHDFDLIIIDGVFSRYLCAKNVLTKIKGNGIIILDNSDWYPNTANFLKENLGFIQVDFYGFRACKPKTAVTSLFLSRNFDWKCRENRQPNYAIGGKIKHSQLDY